MIKKLLLGTTGRQWLKSIHLILSVIWLGAAISMNILRFAWAPSANGDLYAVDHSIAVIDNWVVVPAAWASLLTGFLESWLTTWGFFKYRWVTVKWIVTVPAEGWTRSENTARLNAESRCVFWLDKLESRENQARCSSSFGRNALGAATTP